MERNDTDTYFFHIINNISIQYRYIYAFYIYIYISSRI